MSRMRPLTLLLIGIALPALGVALAQEQPKLPRGPYPTPPNDGQQIRSLVIRRQDNPTTAPSSTPRSRYQTLLRQIEVPDDRKTYGDFCDFGYWSGTSYAGHADLPPGYWVYLAPNWYIFQQEATGATPAGPGTPRQWGPEQATGAPDTWPNSGDLTTAWASATPDGQREWLELTYKTAVRPAAVLVYETYNPGAVDRVTGYDGKGTEVELWSGADPTPAGSEKGISVIPVHPDFDLTKIRIYLDSPKVPGWNEIDAVGLLDATGTTHWADGATASSTYADTLNNPSIQLDSDRLELRSSGEIPRYWERP
jgi:hypothetical protein